MPSRSKSITGANDTNAHQSSRSTSHSGALSRIRTAESLVEDSFARDIRANALLYAGDEDEDDEESDVQTLATSAPTISHGFSLRNPYRRASFAAAGNRGTLTLTSTNTERRTLLTAAERKRVYEEERSLLRDNHLIPPKHVHTGRHKPSQSLTKILSIPTTSTRRSSSDDADGSASSDEETSALLANPSQDYGGLAHPVTVQQKWHDAVKEGLIQTTWQREAKTLSAYSFPLMATFLLQYSLTVASIFTVGHIGKEELGAVSLASMTANITGYAIYQGLATALDTLCPQAYGSGRKKLVGLQTQRMIFFLWSLTLPIAVMWFFADRILMRLVPEPEVAKLAGLYLKVIILGLPGYAAFEAGKRYTQAQGLFSASLYILVICAPLNALLNYLLVWKLEFGFIGAPIAVTITENLLPLGLLIYVRFISRQGMSCWNGFTWQAMRNWGPMITLALPGVIMVEAEVLAFEILTFAASYFGVAVLAAQSVLATITSITFQIPFPLSIAASTRVANLIGATLAAPAKLTTRVALVGAVIIGLANVLLLSLLRHRIPYLFTSDPEVVAIVARVLPICAAFQLFDALAALCNGILRGLGRQHFGGYVQLFCYYVIGMPVSMGSAFGLRWQLEGLWTGVALALGLVAVIELTYIFRTDWQRSVQEAHARNDDEA